VRACHERSCPAGPWAFFVYTVAEKSEPVSARNGLSVNPRYSISGSQHCAGPGGRGTRSIVYKEAVLDWIKKVDPSALARWC
jgi:hypothetical protein